MTVYTDAFVNIDFERERPEEVGSGLIEVPTDEQNRELFGSADFETDYPQLMLTEDQRLNLARERQKSFRADTLQIYSQSNSSACVGFGSCQAFETMHTRIYGHKNHVSFAGMWTYSGIGRSYSSGAFIPDGMNELVVNGACPLANDINEDRDYYTWALLNYDRSRPTESFEQAAKFKVKKWSIARDIAAIESALAQGFCGIVGRSRHCVPYTHLDFDNRGNSFAAYANSWSKSWGQEGFGFDSRAVYRNLALYLIMEIDVTEQITEHSNLPEV